MPPESKNTEKLIKLLDEAFDCIDRVCERDAPKKLENFWQMKRIILNTRKVKAEFSGGTMAEKHFT